MEKLCPTCQRTFPDDATYCPHDGMKLRQVRSPTPEITDPMLGRILDGRWIVEERIGRGGMGAVYRGQQRSVDRQVAIKVLRTDLADTSEFVDRFFQEARVATTVNHPHCVTIHDFGQDADGTLYLAMEFLDGTTLKDRMKAGPVPVEEVLQIGIQIASALATAHDARIVHRDLKPDNIFLLAIPGGGVFVKVLDFGIAKIMGADTQMTRTGQVFGTPDYMSPEQCQGHAVDGRADLYSLGCILYELVGGRPPFVGETPMAVLMAHVVNEVDPLPDAVTSRIPAGLDRLFMGLLAKEPDGRPADASAVRAELERLASSSPGPVTGGLTPTIAAPPTVKMPRDTAPEQSTEALRAQAGLSRRSPALIIVLVIVAFFAISVPLVLALQRGGDTDEEVTTADEAFMDETDQLVEEVQVDVDGDLEGDVDEDMEVVAAEEIEASEEEIAAEETEAAAEEEAAEEAAAPPRPRPRPRPAPAPTPAPAPAPEPTEQPAEPPAQEGPSDQESLFEDLLRD